MGKKNLSEHLNLAKKYRVSSEKLVKAVIFLIKGPDFPGILACLYNETQGRTSFVEVFVAFIN